MTPRAESAPSYIPVKDLRSVDKRRDKTRQRSCGIRQDHYQKLHTLELTKKCTLMNVGAAELGSNQQC